MFKCEIMLDNLRGVILDKDLSHCFHFPLTSRCQTDCFARQDCTLYLKVCSTPDHTANSSQQALKPQAQGADRNFAPVLQLRSPTETAV